ncbi:MAG: hypothetical protein QXU99_07570 [Candidatus Bathyarchaeia archaeon]
MVQKNHITFDALLLEAIDEALNSLGESVKQAIYFHIESKFVAKRDIPNNVKIFQLALEKIFGAGAEFLGILIVKCLQAKLGLTLDLKKDDQFELVNYVEVAKQAFQKERTVS